MKKWARMSPSRATSPCGTTGRRKTPPPRTPRPAPRFAQNVLRKAHGTRLRRVPDSTTYMGINAFIDLRPELLPDELPYSVELQVLARPRFLLCRRYPPNTLRVGHSSTRRPV